MNTYLLCGLLALLCASLSALNFWIGKPLNIASGVFNAACCLYIVVSTIRMWRKERDFAAWRRQNDALIRARFDSMGGGNY